MTPKELRERIARFAVDVERITRPLLEHAESRDTALQVRRSSTGVAANHRAAGRGRSHAEFTAKIGIALEEADETQFWLEHLRHTGLLPEDDVTPVLREASEIVAILTTSCETARRRHPRR